MEGCHMPGMESNPRAETSGFGWFISGGRKRLQIIIVVSSTVLSMNSIHKKIT